MFKKLTLMVLAIVLSGCASVPEDDPWADPRDPFEDFNRDMWAFNEKLDEHVLLPAAEAYENVPEPVRVGLRNVSDNLEEPASLLNNALQGKVTDAGVSFWRFVINSTVGVVGIFDVATPLGLERRRETFGETLASYGVPEGPYLMLPGYGPTVVIDRGADLYDRTYFPRSELDFSARAARTGVKALDTRLQLRQQEQLMQNSLDPYSFVKEAYFQYWRNKVYDGNPPVEPDPLEEELDDDFYDQF